MSRMAIIGTVTRQRRAYRLGLAPHVGADHLLAPEPAPDLTAADMAQQLADDPEYQEMIGAEYAADLAAKTRHAYRR